MALTPGTLLDLLQAAAASGGGPGETCAGLDTGRHRIVAPPVHTGSQAASAIAPVHRRHPATTCEPLDDLFRETSSGLERTDRVASCDLTPAACDAPREAT